MHVHMYICPYKDMIQNNMQITYIYTYTYPPAPACQGPPGCEAYCSHLLIPSPFNYLNHKLTVDFSIHFHSFSVLQSAIGCLPVCLSAFSCLLSAVVSCLVGHGPACYPNFARALNPGSPRKPLKNHKISSLSPGPSKITKVIPGRPKGIKM